uniref:type VI secretion system tube protein TssD n=1 Tax=Pseudomonas viridiflava TaxID=33069 RepID=UPI0013C34869
MPTPAFLSVTGTKQGHITEQAGSIDSLGGHGQIDHPDESIVHAFSHEIISPYDAQSGEITGRRRHNAICITEVFD